MTRLCSIRGAIRIPQNTKEDILDAATELLTAMVRENDVEVGDISSVFFTVTPDLNADFPAHAARDMGWTNVGLMCAREIAVPGAMTRLIRILIHANLPRYQSEMKHQYLGETIRLRPDLQGENNDDRSDEI
jgi:chorismate mutase